MIYATSTTQTFTFHVQIAVSRTRSIRQVARTGIKFTLNNMPTGLLFYSIFNVSTLDRTLEIYQIAETKVMKFI